MTCVRTSFIRVSAPIEEFDSISNHFSYSSPLTVGSLIRPDLESAVDTDKPTFREVVRAVFRLIPPYHNINKIGFSLAFLIQERTVYRNGKTRNSNACLGIAEFRFPHEPPYEHNSIHAIAPPILVLLIQDSVFSLS